MNKYLTKIAAAKKKKPRVKTVDGFKVDVLKPSKPKNVVKKKDNLIKKSRNTL